jgi:hypothetical protein
MLHCCLKHGCLGLTTEDNQFLFIFWLASGAQLTFLFPADYWACISRFCDIDDRLRMCFFNIWTGQLFQKI